MTPKILPVIEVSLVPRSQVEQLADALADLERDLAVLVAIKKAMAAK